MPTLWQQISSQDQMSCSRMVAIMQTMDPRYRSLAVSQLQSWIDPMDGGPYKGDKVEAYAWYPRIADHGNPERMQLVTLGRYTPGSTHADVLMLGWSPGTTPNNVELLDYMLDQILELGTTWLAKLQPSGGLKSLTAIRPWSMGSEAAQLLFSHIYSRAAIEQLPSPPARYVELVRERNLGDAAYWLLALLR